MRPSRVLALILVVLAFPGSLWAQDVIYGCVKNNNGQMRIVTAGEKCLPSERPIQWASSADATVPASKPGATQGPLKVEDQNGLMLGYLVSGTYVARLVDDVWVGVPIAPLGFFVSSSASFAAYYTTAGCSGDAYLPVNAIVREGTVMPTAPDGPLALFYAGKPEVSGEAIQSYGVAGSCWPFAPGSSMPLFGKVASVNLSTFVPPFKIVQ